MNINELLNQVPSTIFVAVGVFVAALIGGLFSYLNILTQKENKVSEFRREWIDELRNQIAIYTSSIQNLSAISNLMDGLEDGKDDNPAKDIDIISLRKDAIESITKITLMLNHKAASNDKGSHEAALLKAAKKARNKLGKSDYNGVKKSVKKLRNAAGPLLKSNWETVKIGEKSYQRIKKFTAIAYFVVIPVAFLSGIYYLHTLTEKQQDNFDQIKRAIQESMSAYQQAEQNKSLHKNTLHHHEQRK